MIERKYIPPEGAPAYPDLEKFKDYLITFEVVALLRPHEKINPERVRLMKIKIKERGYFHKAILIDGKSKTILDGHHKWMAAKELGLVRIPVISVDYLNDSRVHLKKWDTSPLKRLTKRDIIKMGLSENVFPPKTSRHIVTGNPPHIMVPLCELGWYEKHS